MTIEQLKRLPSQPIERTKTPRCDASVSVLTEHEKQWRYNRYGNDGRPFQCSRESVVRIGGKHYCRLHGGHVALAMVLDGKLVEAGE